MFRFPTAKLREGIVAFAVVGGVSEPVVIVQVAEPGSREAGEMVRACTDALRSGTCRIATPKDLNAPDAEGVAIVSWTDQQHQEVRIQVGAIHETGVRWLSRAMVFRAVDALNERWRVVGLSIATLVGDLEAIALGAPAPADAFETEGPVSLSAPPLPPAPKADPAPTTIHPPAATAPPVASAAPPKDPETAPPPASPRRAKQTARWTLGTGPFVSPDAPRLGLWLRGSAYLTPHVMTTMAASYAFRPRDERGLFVSWVGMSTGGSVLLGAPAWGIHPKLRLEFVVERIAASADDSELGESDAQWRLLSGARGGLDIDWRLSRCVSVLLGAESTAYRQGVRIRWSERQVAEFASLNYSILSGLEVAFH